MNTGLEIQKTKKSTYKILLSGNKAENVSHVSKELEKKIKDRLRLEKYKEQKLQSGKQDIRVPSEIKNENKSEKREIDDTTFMPTEMFYKYCGLESFIPKFQKGKQRFPDFSVPKTFKWKEYKVHQQFSKYPMEYWADREHAVLITSIEVFELIHKGFDDILKNLRENRERYYTFKKKRFGKLRNYRTKDMRSTNVPFVGLNENLSPEEKSKLDVSLPFVKYLCFNNRKSKYIEIHVENKQNIARFRKVVEAVEFKKDILHRKRRLSKRARAKALWDAFVNQLRAFSAAHIRCEEQDSAKTT